jgi:glutamine synthetase type III
MLAWALDKGATSFCHWFQPMTSTFRHGDTGQVQMSMLEFNRDGTTTFELKGKHILFGETDGSSYPNGGMRATHTAGGYLAIDPSSPVFLRDDCMFIPCVLRLLQRQGPRREDPPAPRAPGHVQAGREAFQAPGLRSDRHGEQHRP